MIGDLKGVIVFLLLLGVLVVCFSPVADLQPTRILNTAAALLFAAQLLSGVWLGRNATVYSFQKFAPLFHPFPSSTLSLVDLNCIRLC